VGTFLLPDGASAIKHPFIQKTETVLTKKTEYNKTFIIYQRLGLKQCKIQEQKENEIGA